MAEAENNAKSMQRKDAFVSLIQNRSTWCAVGVIIGFLVMLFGFQKCESANDWSYVGPRKDTQVVSSFIFLVGLGVSIAGAIMFIRNLSNKK